MRIEARKRSRECREFPEIPQRAELARPKRQLEIRPGHLANAIDTLRSNVTHATASNTTQLSGGGSAETMGGPRLRKICFRRRVLSVREPCRNPGKGRMSTRLPRCTLLCPCRSRFRLDILRRAPPPRPLPLLPLLLLPRAIFTRSAFSIAPHPAADAAIAIAKDARETLSISLSLAIRPKSVNVDRSGENQVEPAEPLSRASQSIPGDRSRCLAELCHSRSPPERENAIGPTELLRATL